MKQSHIKEKLCTIALCIAGMVTNSHAQASFNVNEDLLLAQFDCKPDADDVHSQAALGCVLADPAYAGVNVYAVLGATGTQTSRFIDSTALFNLIYGPEGANTWTNAEANWNASVTRIKNKVRPILDAGGTVWVQEAGQSDITADWIQALIADGVSTATINNQVTVVQHSLWNENNATAADLAYVQGITNYIAIDDGNVGFGDTSRPERGPDTAGYKLNDTTYLNEVFTGDAHAASEAIWLLADQIIEDSGFSPSWSYITSGGVDFSDFVESWYILGIGSEADTVRKFWDRFVVNTPSSTQGLVADWSFNDNSGAVATDSSGNGFNGTITDGTWISGVSGSALDFNGTTSNVSIPPAAFNRIEASDEVSIAAWVDAANGPVFRAIDSNGRVLNALFNSNGRLYWDAGNSGTSSYDRISKPVASSVHTGGWSHWVFTKNASTGSMKIYLNGNLWHSGSGKTRTINTITSGYIGATSSAGASGIDGSLDEVKLYDRELTDSEVTDLYNTQGDLGVLFQAIGYDEESHPTSGNIIAIAGTKVGKIKNNSWIRFDDFNFGTGASSIVINAGGNGPGGTIQVRKGSSTGTLLGSVSVTNTGDWNVFQPFSTSLSGATGVDDLYFVFVGGGGFLMTVDSFQVN